MKRLLLSLAFALAACGASAQQALVVSTCNTLPTPYLAGRQAPVTVNTNGTLCTTTGGGGGGGDVNLTQIGGNTAAAGAGAVTTGTLRTTLASDDPAVTRLTTIAGAVAGTEMQVDVLTLPAITGTVTANAGTNLNTSLLALESGGNLSSLVTLMSTLAGTVSGTELQVDVLTLPAITGTVAATQSGGWTVTANAGTNLNTSLLALESGGNLAAAAASLAILDDWDETDRAKVNIIAGQAGITAGAGAVAASTPRMTLASDDPAVTSLALLDNVVGTVAPGTAAVASALAGAVYSATPPSPTDGQGQALQTDSRGNLKVVLASANSASYNRMLVNNADDIAASASANNIASIAYLYGWDGATWDRVPATAADGMLVNLGANNDVTVTSIAAGSNNIGDVDVASIAAGNNNIGDVDVASIAAGNNNIGDVDVASIAAGDNNIGNVDIVTLPTVSTASLSSLASAATSAQLLASNSSRKGLIVVNTDANLIYLKYGTTASSTSFSVIIPPNAMWEMPLPIYTGRIDVIWAADGSGSAYATEM